MKLITYNVNGLRANLNKNSLQSLIEQQNPDILCLQEIRCVKTDIEYFLTLIKNIYPFQFINSAIKKGYSGTAILSKINPLNYSFLTNNFSEGRLIMLEFNNFFLVNIYSPNVKPDFQRMDERISVWEKKLNNLAFLLTTKNLILTGDFNAITEEKDSNLKKNIPGSTLFEIQSHKELISNNNLIDIFRFLHPKKISFSWFSSILNKNLKEKKFGMRLDKFLISSKLVEEVKDSYILTDFSGSDHVPVVLECF